MTPVIYNDVVSAVAVVAAVPRDERVTVMSDLLWQAEQAEEHRLICCAVHPLFGDGSLMSAALRHPGKGSVSFQTVEGLTAWLVVLTALRAWLLAAERSSCKAVQRKESAGSGEA